MADGVRKVFVSHGKPDTWLAQQLAKEIRVRGARTFLDETDVPKGADFKSIIRREIVECDELVAIFTPWSAHRFWVWSEVGAAWGQGKSVVAILYGLTLKDLEELGDSKAVFEDINILHLNDADRYLVELGQRVSGDGDD
jgi:hypothetical protein